MIYIYGKSNLTWHNSKLNLLIIYIGTEIVFLISSNIHGVLDFNPRNSSNLFSDSNRERKKESDKPNKACIQY